MDFIINVDTALADFCNYCVKYGSSKEFWVQLFIFVTGVVGQYLVAKKDIRAFYFWSAGNVLIIMSTIPKEQYGMAALYIFAIGFNIYSILQWKKDETDRKNEPEHREKIAAYDGGQVSSLPIANRAGTQG